MHPARRVPVLIGRDGGEEVARVGQAVGADRATLGQCEGAAVILAEIAAGRAAAQLHPQLHAARDDGDLARLDVDDAELGPQPQLALLRDEQQLAVGVVEVFVLHGAGDQVDMRGHAGLRSGIARCRDGAQALEEGQPVAWKRDRVPAHRRRWHLDLRARRRAPQSSIRLAEPPPVLDRGPDAVEPAPLIAGPGRCEGRTAELLGIQSVGAALGRVAPHRQRTGQGLGLEAVPEAGEIARLQAAGPRWGKRLDDVHGSAPAA